MSKLIEFTWIKRTIIKMKKIKKFEDLFNLIRDLIEKKNYN
jgi:hypothetical protein